MIYQGRPADPAAFDDTREDLETALASPERKASAEDVKRFPPFEGQIKRQIFEVRDFRA